MDNYKLDLLFFFFLFRSASLMTTFSMSISSFFPINNKFCFSNPPKIHFLAPIPSNLKLFRVERFFKSTIFVSVSIAHDDFLVWIACSSCFIGYLSPSSFALCRTYSWINNHSNFWKTQDSHPGNLCLS